jgi:hypothetical protein
MLIPFYIPHFFEYYHIYNRGTDKRDIFLDKEDVWRFYKSLIFIIVPGGSILLRDKLFKFSNASTLKLGIFSTISFNFSMLALTHFINYIQ